MHDTQLQAVTSIVPWVAVQVIMLVVVDLEGVSKIRENFHFQLPRLRFYHWRKFISVLPFIM